MKKICIIALGLLILFSSVAAFGKDPLNIDLTMPSARTSSTGGIHVGLTDDMSTLFSNPAGFITAEPQFAVAELTFGLSGPVLSMSNIIIEGVQGDTDFQKIIERSDVQTLLNTLYSAIDLAGPLYFGYVGNGLGFGIANRSFVEIKNPDKKHLTASVQELALLSGGYSFRIPLPEAWNSTLDTGVLLKGILHGQVDIPKKSYIEFIDLIESFDADLVLGEQFSLTTGIGIDAGILYTYRNFFTVGIVGRNLLGPTITNTYTSVNDFLDNKDPEGDPSYGRLPIDLTAGVLLSPEFESIQRYITDVKLMLDYRDILDFVTHPATARNPVLKVGLGLELQFLDILALRGGFNDGFFTTGLGLDLTLFQLNLAVYGSELSTQPGIKPVYNIILGLSFRI